MIPRYAIIVAGGSGTRMGTDIPKQFLDLDGKSILRRSIERGPSQRTHRSLEDPLPAR